MPRALASEECTDRAAAEPTKLLEKDQELSDLGGAIHGGHNGVMYCLRHLAEIARSQSPAGPALTRGAKPDSSHFSPPSTSLLGSKG